MAWFPSVRSLTSSRLRGQVHILKLVCVILRINPMENEEIRQISRELLSIYFFSFTRLSPHL